MQPTLGNSRESSFRDVRDRVYAEPLPPDRLPSYDGASDWETIRAIFLNSVSARIAASMKRALADPDDCKDDRPKLFHPKGVCAEARWEIFADAGYTGLFAPGAGVPAIVRMSASGNNTRFDARFPAIPLLQRPRSFGLAIKLFPSPDPERKVRTRNLLLFDQTGVDGNPSPWYMRGARQRDGTHAEQYFLNWMHGTGPVTSGFARLFSRFAGDVRHRLVDPLAGIDSSGNSVAEPRSPRFVRLIPSARYPESETAANWGDFRLEVLDLARLGPLSFGIAASESNPVETPPPREEALIGRLTLGSPVVSTFGDCRLHFTHAVS
jgi:hypothetical protein